MSLRTPHRRLTAAVALLVAAAGIAVAPAPAALAAPAPLAAPAQDDEGGTDTLRKQLDDASRGFLEAQEALAASKKRQAELAERLKTIDADLAGRSAGTREIAGQSYRTGRAGPISALLNAKTPEGFLGKASTLQVVTLKKDRAVRELTRIKSTEEQTRAAIAAEISNDEKQVAVMAKRKQQAESALAAAQVGGGPAAGPSGKSATSKSAPRGSDGSFGSESCSTDDPTTSGCITPRTLFAMNQAKSAGFTRFVSCFRPSGAGEHPKGRACDFAAQKSGFGGVATGGDKTYGDDLANYFINNAGRLGVLYVIWFERIWLPSSGWRAYSRGQGDPSSDHTNHVHLSMR